MIPRVVSVLAVGLLCTGNARAQEVKLDELLERAGAYVKQFVSRFSNVVAEEHYKQEATSPRRQRVLRSDFLLVMFPGASEWYTFRDVVEVDGKPVGNRNERLAQLFVDAPRDLLRRARDISDAGARFNLPGMGSVNNPLLAMAFVQEKYRDRFRFNLAGLDKDFGPGVRIVRFQEFRRPSVLKLNGNNDILVEGLIWIEESSGRLVQTELQIGSQRIPTRIVTRFAPDEELQVNVPVEMRDWYPDGMGEIRGVATYGKFRRFQVQTLEQIN